MPEDTEEQRSAYQEQTEEDLKSVPPMSGMQKGILIGAALFIVAFVLYYAFF